MIRYTASTPLPVNSQSAFAYHERRGALQRLVPPWKNLSIEQSDGSLRSGSRVVLRIGLGPLSLRWVAEHSEYDPPRLFADHQVSGPFAHWHHDHRFSEAGDEQCVLHDEVEYRLPLGFLGQLAGGAFARTELESMFAYRHRITRDDLMLADKYRVGPFRVAVSGASGLVGRRLCGLLSLLGHDVIRLERSPEKAQGDASVAPWSSPEQAARLEGVDAVVHLAGKPIADGRWSENAKREIRESRVMLTRQLAEILARLESKPTVFVCASAIGIYGDRADETLTETSALGEGFLAEVGREWESACEPAAAAGIRVANARLGIVLDPNGGALQKMLFPAKLGGGRVGSGKQWWSWVALDDVVGSLYHAVCCDKVAGPFNLTAPQPETAATFAQILGRVLRRPALIPAPSFLLRAAMGEMADALLLCSARVEPRLLRDTGYEFRFSGLEGALRYCLGKDRLESTE